VLRGYLSPALINLIDMANTDLYSGPLYLRADGETCSMFDDDYDHAFDFSRACTIITDTLDRRLPSALYYEQWSGCAHTVMPEPYEDEDGEIIAPDYSDYTVYDQRDMLALIVGKELAHHI